MIIVLLGKSGVGKTTIGEAMENFVPDSFLIDGDDLRMETNNVNVGVEGRIRNMELGFSRARWLSDLGFTVFLAMQAPIKEIRQKYLKENDIQILLTNSGPNPKDEKGYNKNFFADYSDVEETYEFTEFTPEDFYTKFFPKVLVIARFQGMHKGHKIIIEEAKRISPNITIGLRVDDGDLLDLHENIEAIKKIYPEFNYVQTPKLSDENKVWEKFIKDGEYDIIVQGNPDVIRKFQKLVDSEEVKLHFVPRIGHVSATKIREAVKRGDIDYAKANVANPNILDLLQKELQEGSNEK